MLKPIGKAVVHSLGLRPPRRNVEVFADHVFVVPYPKSGNTWRKLERFQAETEGTLNPVRVQRPFVRSATVGGWRRELPPALAARIAARWGTTMAVLGYGEPATEPELAGETAS